MIWTVIYRDDASGRQGKVEIEAANRGDVFLQMNARKLRVLNVVEGQLVAEKPSKKKSKAAPSNLGRRFLFWLVFLLVAGGSAYWILRDSPMVQECLKQPDPEQKPAGSVTIQPASTDVRSAEKREKSGVRITPAAAPSSPLESPLHPHGEK